MAADRRSLVSAHHNYLVNNMLSPGFVLGNPDSPRGFYFLADVVLPGESTPRISGRFFDASAALLVELHWNRMIENPGSCLYQPEPGGFRIASGSGDVLLTVHTERFPNGYLTRIQGRLYDDLGRLRVEPSCEGVQVYGNVLLSLAEPFQFSKK